MEPIENIEEVRECYEITLEGAAESTEDTSQPVKPTVSTGESTYDT